MKINEFLKSNGTIRDFKKFQVDKLRNFHAVSENFKKCLSEIKIIFCEKNFSNFFNVFWKIFEKLQENLV